PCISCMLLYLQKHNCTNVQTHKNTFVVYCLRSKGSAPKLINTNSSVWFISFLPDATPVAGAMNLET
ncbi:hypothetical protein, partial [Enterococcus faecium]|uniref:hypothetical protein n=1 Tax=Enterococcus faecium TaxID=1352 RepID=UPI0034E93AE3